MTTSPTGRGRAAGFTLLELLVAITIMGIVTGMIYGGFAAGLRGYRSGLARGEQTRDWLGLNALLRADLARRVVHEKYPLQACRDRVGFVIAESGKTTRLRQVRYAIEGASLRRELSDVDSAVDAAGGAPTGGPPSAPPDVTQALFGPVLEGGFDVLAASARPGPGADDASARSGSGGVDCQAKGAPAAGAAAGAGHDEGQRGLRLRLRVGEPDAATWYAGVWLLPVTGQLAAPAAPAASAARQGAP